MTSGDDYEGRRMVARDEFMQAAVSAIRASRSATIQAYAVAVLDAVEPLIRKDEQQLSAPLEQVGEVVAAATIGTRREVLADLRDDVQGMRAEAATALEHAEGYTETTAAAVGMSVLDDVLALLDEAAG